MTSRLCSMMTTVFPWSTSLFSTSRSLWVSAKCSPVVGSSRMYSVRPVPRRDNSVALTAFAAAPLDVEGEPPRPEPPRARLRQHREQLANEREESRISRRIRTRRAADRRLIDLDHLVDQVDAVDRRVGAGLVRRSIQHSRERAVQDLVDERRF